MRVLRVGQRPVAEIVLEVARCVQQGGTVIFPTETVYGIGCDPENDCAIDAIYVAKGRSERKPLALHVAGIEAARPFVRSLPECARAAIQRFWPGPLAIIVPRAPGRFERAACGLATISLRCPSDALALALLKGAGPLAATSANRSGQPAFRGNEESPTLPEAALAVLAGPTQFGQESTILDCSGQAPVILREGVIPSERVKGALGTLPAAP